MNAIYNIVKNNQSSFFWLMQFLPKAQKVGAYTIFAFNHHIEKEIVKSNISTQEKLEMLSAWNEEINNIFDKKAPQTEIGRKIYKNCLRFNIEKDLFLRIINAYIASLKAKNFNPNLLEYKRFCDDVYGARIEMGLKIFNYDDKRLAKYLAEFIHPVVSLENMKEDCQLGFVYIPSEFLKQAGIETKNPIDILKDPKLLLARNQMLELANYNLNRLEGYYPHVKKQNLKLLRGFVNIYKKYLEIMQKRGMEVISPKPMLSNFSKIKIILKSMLG